MDQLSEENNDNDHIDAEVPQQIKKKRKPKTPHKKTPEEFRKMIVDAIESGRCTRKTAAKTFNLPYHTIVTIYKQFLDTGEVESKQRGRFKPKKLKEEHIKFLLDTLADNCNYNIKDLVEMIKTKFAMEVSYGIVSKEIPAFHYSLKRITDPCLSSCNEETFNENKEYCDIFVKLTNNERVLVYFDQADFQVTMRRFPGRVPEGEGSHMIPPPSIRSRNKTVMVSITEKTIIYYKTSDEPVKRKLLLEYLSGLFDALSTQNIIGAVIIMGNSVFAHYQVVKEVIQAAGHLVMFLPSHSALFNPVECLFSQWCEIVRSKNPTNERQVDELVDTFKGAIDNKKCQQFCEIAIENAVKCSNGNLSYTD